MTTKEMIINQTIARCEKELKNVLFLLESTPLLEICKIRQDAQKLLEENKTIEQRTSTKFIAKINELSKKEKEQFAIAEKTKDTLKLIDKRVKLESELSGLRTELYFINRSK